jgi:hypothetical protein
MMPARVAVGLALLCAAPPPAVADPVPTASLPAGLGPASTDDGPAIAEVIVAAHAAAGLDQDQLASWTRRARLAGLVPWLSLRTGRDTRWRDDATDVIHLDTVEVRATWRLERLVFDREELRAASLDHARRRDRRRLASRVVRAYYAWRRAALTATLDPRAATRADEAIGELDALTEGWFSAALAARGSPKLAPP